MIRLDDVLISHTIEVDLFSPYIGTMRSPGLAVEPVGTLDQSNVFELVHLQCLVRHLLCERIMWTKQGKPSIVFGLCGE